MGRGVVVLPGEGEQWIDWEGKTTNSLGIKPVIFSGEDWSGVYLQVK